MLGPMECGCFLQGVQGLEVQTWHQLWSPPGWHTEHDWPHWPQLLLSAVRSISQPSCQLLLQSPKSAITEQPAQ
jgi:hypothetical protein